MLCIYGKDGNTKVSLENKMELWKEYEEKRVNKEKEWVGELYNEKMKDFLKKCLLKLPDQVV